MSTAVFLVTDDLTNNQVKTDSNELNFQTKSLIGLNAEIETSFTWNDELSDPTSKEYSTKRLQLETDLKSLLELDENIDKVTMIECKFIRDGTRSKAIYSLIINGKSVSIIEDAASESLGSKSTILRGFEINKCRIGTDNCSANGSCQNQPGSFSCECNDGFEGDGIDCIDIDECLDPSCHYHATCENKIGSYSCQCKDGFRGDGVTCDDIDECQVNPCGSHASCDNTIGNFECYCDVGFDGDGFICHES